MTNDVSRALIAPLQNAALTLPEGGRILLINCDYGLLAPAFPLTQTTCWHWIKSASQSWASGGYDVLTERPTGLYGAIFLILPPQRLAALGLLAQAQGLLEHDGVLIVAAPNDGGGRRLVADLSPFCPRLQNISKHKSRVVWARRPDMSSFPEAWMGGAAMQKHPVTGLWTQPGIFSWDRVDAATQLLCPFIPHDQMGVFVDPGCGTGVITCDIIKYNPQALCVLAFDHDVRAVEACRRNVVALEVGVSTHIEWQDFTRLSATQKADWVIMNPPFHQGKDEQIDLGQNFITSAAGWLKPGGTLLMVANAHLPYEKKLRECFSAVEKCFEGDGYKIFKARL